MRILLINDGASPHTGGMNRVVVETCDWLARAGHEVALAYHDDHPVVVSCKTFHVPERWPMRQRIPELNKVVDAFKPDVIHNHSTKILPGLPALVEKRPTCTFVHDQSWFCSSLDRMTRGYVPCHRPHGVGCLVCHYTMGCGGKNPMGNWDRWKYIQRRIHIRELRRSRVQVASQFMRRGLFENGFAEDRIDLVPLFAEPPPAEGLVEPGLMLLPSRLVPSKGIHVAIEAAATLIDIPWKLVIAGAGPQRPELEALARRLGVDRRVQFLGEISPADLAPWYARSQLVLFPVLRPEPFGLIGVEALAYGRPIVAFEGGAVEEWLWPDETGLLVSRRTAAAFGQAIGELLNNQARCRLMGNAARARYAFFHPSTYIERLVESFERTREWHRQSVVSKG